MLRSLAAEADRLGMVAGAVRDNAAFCPGIGQLHDGVVGPRELERPDFLPLLALEKQPPPRHLIQGGASRDRRSMGDAGNGLLSGADVGKGNGVIVRHGNTSQEPALSGLARNPIEPRKPEIAKRSFGNAARSGVVGLSPVRDGRGSPALSAGIGNRSDSAWSRSDIRVALCPIRSSLRDLRPAIATRSRH